MFLSGDDANQLRWGLDLPGEPGPRFPSWPFGLRRGFVTVFSFDGMLSSDFGAVLDALCAFYGDEYAGMVALEPSATYFVDSYGYSPYVKLPGTAPGSEFESDVWFEPGGDLTGSLWFGLNTGALAGSSGAWAIHGERSWELSVLITADPDGPWRSTGLPWVARSDARDFRGPVGWVSPDTDAEWEEFESNLRFGEVAAAEES